MDFLKINYRKIGNKFLFSSLLWSIGCLFYYLSLLKKDLTSLEISEEIQMTIVVVAIFHVVGFSIYMFGNMEGFYVERRLLRDVLSRGIFDDDKYSSEKIYRKVWLVYTRECVFGRINGFPTLLRVHIHVAKNTTYNVEFYVYVTKTGRIQCKALSILLENKRIPYDINDRILNFISEMKNKGFVAADVQDGKFAASMIKVW